MELSFKTAGATHVGKVRLNNEDGFLAHPPLLAVADGVGGRPAGEVASSVAMTVVSRAFELWRDVEGALHLAHEAVKSIGVTNSLLTGLCTTLTAALLDADKASIYHVGDCRVHLVRDGVIEVVTTDQNVVNKGLADGTLTEERAATLPNPRLLFQAIGSMKTEKLDIWTYEVDLQPGDRLLLATDGLEYADPTRVLETLASEADPQTACDLLVDATLQAGAPDNVTVVLTDVS